MLTETATNSYKHTQKLTATGNFGEKLLMWLGDFGTIYIFKILPLQRYNLYLFKAKRNRYIEAKFYSA
jgi:hypothetical protein